MGVEGLHYVTLSDLLGTCIRRNLRSVFPLTQANRIDYDDEKSEILGSRKIYRCSGCLQDFRNFMTLVMCEKYSFPTDRK